MDECATKNGGCQQECSNALGTFACSCNAGFVSASNLCVDVDECQTANGGCSQNCLNTNNGSFLCSCSEGYRLSGLTSCVGEWALISKDMVMIINFILIYVYVFSSTVSLVEMYGCCRKTIFM